MKPALPPRRWLKTLRVAFQLGWGALRILFIHDPFAPHNARIIRTWHKAICRALGLEVVVHGQPLPGALYVSNHISWLDIPVLASLIEGSRFLSKSEVRDWPLIGLLARRAGTLFIQRGNGQKEASAQITQGLGEGHGIILFPEATTTDGLSLRRFHPRLLQAAIDAGVPVQPIALRYLDADGQPNPRAAYTHGDTVMDTFRRVVAEDGLRVEVYFLPPLQPSGATRTQLADLAQTQVAQTLALPILSGREDA
ncbi:MAG: lysophospholipid acyltransferase family protein [Gammaproteobacteria bacterium]|nr:lysophospholipid acyltransferase family protein [Gammaproteobacteria bacterium]